MASNSHPMASDIVIKSNMNWDACSKTGEVYQYHNWIASPARQTTDWYTAYCSCASYLLSQWILTVSNSHRAWNCGYVYADPGPRAPADSNQPEDKMPALYYVGDGDRTTYSTGRGMIWLCSTMGINSESLNGGHYRITIVLYQWDDLACVSVAMKSKVR